MGKGIERLLLLRRYILIAFSAIAVLPVSLAAQLDHFDFDPVANDTAGSPIPLTIYAKEASGDIDSSFTGTCTLEDSTDSISPTVTGNFENGRWSGNVTIATANFGDVITAESGPASGSSNAFNVFPAALHHFSFSPITGTKTAGVPFPVTITARDLYENQVISFNGTVTLTDLTDSVEPGSVIFSTGQWSDSLTVKVATASDYVTASYSGGITGTSDPFPVSNNVLDHFTFSTIGPAQTAGVPFAVTIQARDAYENLVDEFGSIVNLDDVTHNLIPTSAGFDAGQWSDSLTVTEAILSDSVTASYTGGKTGTSNPFAVNNGVLHHFTFSAIGGTQTAGVPFGVTIQARDAYENLVDEFGSIVNLEDETGSLDPTTADFNGGQWSDNLTVTIAIASDTVKAIYNSVTSKSNAFMVDNNVLEHFDFSTISSPQTAGVAFKDTIWARDAYGNTVPEFTQKVFLWDNSGSLSPDSSGNFVSGMWSGLFTISDVYSNDRIYALGGGRSGQSYLFNVVANEVHHFEFAPITGDKVAGDDFQIVIYAKDEGGNTVLSYNGHAFLDDLTHKINPNETVPNFQNGQWTGEVSITEAMTNDQITADDTENDIQGTSDAFNVVAASLNQFDFEPIGNKMAGAPFQITIWALDQYENIVLTHTKSADLTDSTGTIYPDTTNSFSNGRSISQVTVTRALVGEWIEATDDTVTKRSNSFTVLPAALDRFEFATISDQTAGIGFPIIIEAYDAYGNLKTNFTSSAGLTDLSASITPTVTGPFTAGVWQGDVTIAESYMADRIIASASNKTGFSNSFDVVAGELDHFDFSAIPTQVVAGDDFTVIITARDSEDNQLMNFDAGVWLYDISGTFSDTVAMAGGTWSGPVSVTLAMEDDRLTAEYSGIQSHSTFFDVIPAIPEFLVLEPPGPFSITVKASQVFTATVTDPYSNRVPNASVTFQLKGTVYGALDDNPADTVYNTAGDNDLQTGSTNPDGVLTVRYTAPETAGLVDVLDAFSSNQVPAGEVVDVTITSVDSGATRLVFEPADPQEIRIESGEIFTIVIEAQDGFGNVDTDDTTLVQISSASGAMEFSRDNFATPLTQWKLSAGSDTLQARSCLAADNDTIRVQDTDGQGILLSPGSKSQVYIEQGPPWGTILLAASRDTLTANGISVTTISSEAIIDSCGNTVVEGTLITVSASPEILGTITSPDQDPATPGIQVATDAEGTIEFTLRSGTTAGTCTVAAVSKEGSALGTINIHFQSPASLVYAEGSLYPNTVSPAESVSFNVVVKNEGEAGITLDTQSFFRFTDNFHPYVAYLEAPLSLPGGSDWDTLAFEEETIPDSIMVKSYTPTVYLHGIDTNGSGYAQTLSLDLDGLQISHMRLVYVQVAPDTASVEDSLEVTLAVENMAEQSVTIDSYGLVITPPSDFAQATGGPVVIPKRVTGYLAVGLKINPLTPTGKYYIDGFVSGHSAGGEVSDDSADLIDSLVVISLATAEYVPGSLTPRTLSPGGEYALHVRVKNSGESAVNLSAQSTKISFAEGDDVYEATLAAGTQMAGGGEVTELLFSERTLAPGFATGEFPVSVYLSGLTLSGGDFEQLLADVDTVVVQSAPVISYLEGSLSQEKISRGFPLTLSVRVTNAGQATLGLDAQGTSVVITDGETVYKPLLNVGLVDEVSPGDTSLTFQTATFPTNFDTDTLGYLPLFVMEGDYNGITLYDTLGLDTVLVQVPATLRVSAERSDTVVTIGQSFTVEATIKNLGEAGVRDEGTLLLDLSGTSFSVADPVIAFGPSLPDTLVWTVTVPDTSSTGIFDIAVEIETIPHDENTDPPQPAFLYQGGRDEISVSVVEGNDLVVSMVEIPGIPPGNVSAGQSGIPVLALQLANRGNAKSELQIDSMRVSLRERDGGSISPASSVITGLFVSNDAGGSSVITQAGDLSGQAVLLDFSSQDVRLATTAPDTLYFSLSLGSSPGTETVLLHLAGGEDIHATDSLSHRQAAVVDPLGAPLAALTSDFLVLNDDDFKTSFKNFPNPFRAGSENTTFSYYLPRNAGLDLSIYTLTGELVKKFHFAPGSGGGSGPGMNSFTWDGKNGNGHLVLNGVYLCVVTADLEGGNALSLKHKVAVMK
jgi:hypothetical protein